MAVPRPGTIAALSLVLIVMPETLPNRGVADKEELSPALQASSPSSRTTRRWAKPAAQANEPARRRKHSATGR